MINNLNQNIDNLIKVAQSKKDQNNLFEALDILKKVIRKDPENKKALNNIANIFKDKSDYEEAIRFYKKSISVDPNYNIAKTNLALLYHELGNLIEAENLYKELIKSDNKNFSIYFNLSRINLSFFNDEIITHITASLKREDISNYNKASGFFILAKNEQRKKNYEKEIEYLKKGHEFFCKSVNFKIFNQSLSYWLKYIPKKFDKIKIMNNELIDKKNKLFNPIFIIGAPRSGSTLIEGIISSGKIKVPHGGETATINWGLIKSIREKNPNFNLDETDDLIIDFKKISTDIIERYESLNLIKKEKKYFFIDKSLENFFYIELILKIFPNAKFIHCERNYLDTVFAIYQNFLTKMSWTHSFENILIYLDNYISAIKYFKKKYNDKIFSVNLSELTVNTVKVSKEIFNFCNLEWSEKSLEFYKRKDLISKTASNIQIREKIYKYDDEKYIIYKKFIRKFEDKYSWLNKDI